MGSITKESALKNRVLYARKGGEDVAATAANLGGDKITVEEAIKLKDFCWGGPNIVPRAEWIKSGLVFHIPEQTNAYGLNATKGAVKAFQIVIESFILKHLLFEGKTKKGSKDKGRKMVSKKDQYEGPLSVRMT